MDLIKSKKERLETMKKEVKELQAAEKADPTELPKLTTVEKMLSARIRGVGTATQYDKFIAKQTEEGAAAPTGAQAADKPLSRRAEVLRQKLAEIKELEREIEDDAAIAKAPSEMPKLTIVEKMISARIRGVGTADAFEGYLKAQARAEQDTQRAIATKQAQAAEAAKAAEALKTQQQQAAIKMQAVQRGKSARGAAESPATANKAAKHTPEAPAPAEDISTGAKVDNFFSFIAALGQQQQQKRAEVRQNV